MLASNTKKCIHYTSQMLISSTQILTLFQAYLETYFMLVHVSWHFWVKIGAMANRDTGYNKKWCVCKPPLATSDLTPYLLWSKYHTQKFGSFTTLLRKFWQIFMTFSLVDCFQVVFPKRIFHRITLLRGIIKWG